MICMLHKAGDIGIGVSCTTLCCASAHSVTDYSYQDDKACNLRRSYEDGLASNVVGLSGPSIGRQRPFPARSALNVRILEGIWTASCMLLLVGVLIR